MFGTNQPPFIDRRKVRVSGRKYDEMGVLALVCLGLATAIIVLAMMTRSHAHPEMPVACKPYATECFI